MTDMATQRVMPAADTVGSLTAAERDGQMPYLDGNFQDVGSGSLSCARRQIIRFTQRRRRAVGWQPAQAPISRRGSPSQR